MKLFINCLIKSRFDGTGVKLIGSRELSITGASIIIRAEKPS